MVLKKIKIHIRLWDTLHWIPNDTKRYSVVN